MARLQDLLRSVTSSSSSPPYCPDVGDYIWLQFDPQAGREQAGHRPAIVLSPYKYNEHSRLCIVCPITTKPKGYPFEVAVVGGQKIVGAVLADQIKSLSWTDRHAEFAEKASPEVLGKVLGMAKALLGI